MDKRKQIMSIIKYLVDNRYYDMYDFQIYQEMIRNKINKNITQKEKDEIIKQLIRIFKIQNLIIDLELGEWETTLTDGTINKDIFKW